MTDPGRPGAPSHQAFDPRNARRAAGLLGAFSAAGVLAAADVHVAQALGRLRGETDESVLLALALAVRTTRQGSVVLDLATVATTTGPGEDVAGDAAEDAPQPPDASDAVNAPDGAPPPWPAPVDWLARCLVSPLVAVGDVEADGRPLRAAEGLLWLQRYWQQESQLVEDLLAAAAEDVERLDPDRLRRALDRLFPSAEPDDQRLAAAVCALRRLAVVVGGPGTGKTTTVAKLLALLHDQPEPPRLVGLAAPTGKAAARLTEAFAQARAELPAVDRGRLPVLEATTLHRLLGRRPDARSRFRHDREDRLPHDVVVIDEASMVSLTLMARLLEALRPQARLVLLGDPDQLASVEAGAVLGDLVDPARVGARTAAVTAALRDVVPLDVPADAPLVADSGGARLRDGIALLRTVHRFAEGGGIAALAAAARQGDGPEALRLLETGAVDLDFLAVPDDRSVGGGALARLRAEAVATGGAITAAARAGDAVAALDALERHRLLCAHRLGPRGVRRWSEQVTRWLAEAEPATEGPARSDGRYVGEPLLVTTNDSDTKLFNGDSGVVVADGTGGLVAAFRRGANPFLVPLARLSGVQPLRAMTVHRSQGSQFARVTVLLPPAGSPLGTRETFYTAVTRAREHVLVVGSPEAVLSAISRPIARATGLRRRLA